MKVLLVNKFYYLRGGDCTAVFAIERLLREKGHEVAVFSMQYPDNEHTIWSKYFPEEVRFSAAGLFGTAVAATRIFHSPEVAGKFKQLLSDFKPDVVHLHNIHSYISPLVAGIARKQGIRVVWTLHDYKLVCPTYNCLRNGRVCEACFHNKFNVVRHKCMKNSLLASKLAWMEALYWNRKKLSRLTDTFISPSAFLKTKMTEAGYSPDQIEVLPNFMPQKQTPATAKGDYYCYVGRISAEKGLDTLLQAAARLPYPLKIIGGGPLLDAYRKQYPQKHIEFTGQTPPEALYPVVRDARFLAIPSIWYENNPYSVIEALCMGTPVLGARTGGIPELITEGENGFLFAPGDTTAMQEKIRLFFSRDGNRFDAEKISSEAYNKFSPDTFYNKLIKYYCQS